MGKRKDFPNAKEAIATLPTNAVRQDKREAMVYKSPGKLSSPSAANKPRWQARNEPKPNSRSIYTSIRLIRANVFGGGQNLVWLSNYLDAFVVFRADPSLQFLRCGSSPIPPYRVVRVDAFLRRAGESGEPDGAKSD